MSAPTPSYRALFAVPGFPRLASSMLLARTANQMGALVIVLFVLDRYHSPQLAGLAVAGALIPGLLLSPLAGALLDRGARVLLVSVDYCVSASMLVAIVLLALAGALPAWLLVVLLALGSTTTPLSNSGVRSLFPTLVPRRLWDRANAVDSGMFVVATIAGPGLAGAIVAVLHPTLALLVPAGLSLGAAAFLAGMHLPRPATPPSAGILRDAAAGLRYVVRNRGLRGLAACVSVLNIGNGAVTVATPVLVLSRLHGSSAQVGALFAVMGGGGVIAGLASGRIDTEGRERRLLVLGCLGSVVGLALMAAAPGYAVAAAGMLVYGLSNGPLDVALFSLRQRVTDPAWLGRAFAVSASLNFVGYPIGSAISGPLAAHSPGVALAVAAGFAAAAAGAAQLMLPPRSRPAAMHDAGAAHAAHTR
jgi:MFS family permease